MFAGLIILYLHITSDVSNPIAWLRIVSTTYFLTAIIWGRPTFNTRTSTNLCSCSTFQERFFSRNFNAIETSCCSHPSFGEMIVMKFCTWHGNCGKFCSNMIPTIKLHLKASFHRIWITLGKSFMNWAPGVRRNIKMSSYRYIWVLWYWNLIFIMEISIPERWHVINSIPAATGIDKSWKSHA